MSCVHCLLSPRLRSTFLPELSEIEVHQVALRTSVLPNSHRSCPPTVCEGVIVLVVVIVAVVAAVSVVVVVLSQLF